MKKESKVLTNVLIIVITIALVIFFIGTDDTDRKAADELASGIVTSFIITGAIILLISINGTNSKRN